MLHAPVAAFEWNASNYKNNLNNDWKVNKYCQTFRYSLSGCCGITRLLLSILVCFKCFTQYYFRVWDFNKFCASSEIFCNNKFAIICNHMFARDCNKGWKRLISILGNLKIIQWFSRNISVATSVVFPYKHIQN